MKVLKELESIGQKVLITRLLMKIYFENCYCSYQAIIFYSLFKI